MLIAMLFGPIIGIALALAEGDMRLLGRALVAEIAGAALSLALGYAIGIASRGLSMGNEILARSSPSLIDLMVALIGGMAGGFTYVGKGLADVVVGVAIAISLVPPLTSCGILLAHQLPALAAGALLLFLANFSAITIGAMIVFWLAGHRPTSSSAQNVLMPRVVSVALLVILAAHFTVTFRQTITRSLFENGIRETLGREVAKIPGARVVSVTFTRGGEAIAVVRAPQPISPDQVGRLNDLVDRAVGTTVDLHVRSVITAETTRHGNVYQSLVDEDHGP
jgi:uncharacterized hydrophobic protein (TIGR00271 family)